MRLLKLSWQSVDLDNLRGPDETAIADRMFFFSFNKKNRLLGDSTATKDPCLTKIASQHSREYDPVRLEASTASLEGSVGKV